ncbi:MAG: nicotinate-nucleotide adenylyltransferase [Chlamydiota bacterium]
MVDQSKHVGILGGSFNPVHLGHLHLAHELKSRYQLDEVWFIPVYQNPHKLNRPTVSPFHRLEMLRLAVQDEPSYHVLDLECKRKGASYTVDTLKYLCGKYPDNQYYLLLGTDIIKRFHEWKAPHEILQLCKLVIASRGHENVSLNYGDENLKASVMSSFISIPLLDISSTQIRFLVEQGGDFQHLVPAQVYQYIERKGLYTSDWK